MKYFLLATVLLTTQAFAKISELPSYADFDQTLINSQTLVIFDIDNTLLRQDHMIGTHQWGDYIKARAIKKGLPPEKAAALQHRLFGEVQPYLQVVPVESSVIKILKLLEASQIPHFALTARGAIIRDVTLRQVKTLQHDFNHNFPEQLQPIGFAEHLHDGIIFSGGIPKGELLKKIIENSVRKPKRIIFFDDRKYNLDSVEESFKDSDIEMISLRYGGADKIVEKFNPEAADLVYSFLLEDKYLVNEAWAAQNAKNIEAVVQQRFFNHLADQGPLAEPSEGCTNKNFPFERTVIFSCDYTYDESRAGVEFVFNLDEAGAITFGHW